MTPKPGESGEKGANRANQEDSRQAGRKVESVEELRELLSAHLHEEAGPHSMKVAVETGLTACDLADSLLTQQSQERAEPPSAEELARFFHHSYERIAPTVGYETRPDSAVPWEKAPEQNRRLMILVAGEVLEWLAASPGKGAEGEP